MFKAIKNMFQKASKTGYAVYLNNKNAQWSPRNYRAFADEGYQKNVIAYQAINKKAKAIAQIPWIIKTKSGADVTGGPLFDAIQNPNPVQSRKEWLEASVGFYCISGNLYWEKTDVSLGVAPEFYAKRSDRMTIKIGPDGFPSEFVYKIRNQTVTYDRPGLIRHIKTFNPLDDVYGMSPIEAAAYSIDQHNESNKWLQALLQNGASPSGALVCDEIGDEQFNRLKAEIDEKYSGSANAGRPLLLEGGMKWQQMGLSPQNMSILESKFSSARDIALAFEVPPLLLNIPGDSTYSNYKEARQAFYEETVIPTAELFVDEFNSFNEDRLKGAKVVLDLDQVPAIIEKRQMWWEMADKSMDLTINERRELKGFEPIEGGDELYIESNKIPLSFDAVDDAEQSAEEAQQKGAEAYGNANRER